MNFIGIKASGFWVHFAFIEELSFGVVILRQFNTIIQSTRFRCSSCGDALNWGLFSCRIFRVFPLFLGKFHYSLTVGGRAANSRPVRHNKTVYANFVDSKSNLSADKGMYLIMSIRILAYINMNKDTECRLRWSQSIFALFWRFFVFIRLITESKIRMRLMRAEGFQKNIFHLRETSCFHTLEVWRVSCF